MTNRFLSKDQVGLAVRIHVEGETQMEDRAIQIVTSPGFFSAAGIDFAPAVAFTERDNGTSPQVVIVNERYARRRRVERHRS